MRPYNQAEVKAGDFLSVRYGNGTQIVYVVAIKPTVRRRVTQNARGKLSIYRMTGYAIRWTGPRDISTNDARLLEIYEAKPPGIPDPPVNGFIPAR